MIISELPDTWLLSKLGELCFTTSGGTPSRKRDDFYNGNIPWVKSGELSKGLITKTEEYITEEAVKNSSAKIFPTGTLLIALYGATIGKLGFLGVDAATNQAICGIYKNDFLDLNYLYYFLYHNKNKLIEQGAGGAQPNISQTILKDLDVTVPPLSEQQRIVDKIEELFSELDKGIEILKTAQQQLKVYRQSVLKYAFEGKLTNPDVKEGELPEGWVVKSFGECTINYDGKRVPLSKEVRSKRRGDYRYYGATEIVDYIDYYIFEGEYLLIGEDGANLLSKSKPLAHIVEGQFWVNNHAHIVKAQFDISIKYLNNFFNSLHLDQFVTGTAQPKLTQANMNKIPVTLPVSIVEQNQIVQEIESRLSVCDKIEESIEQGLQQAEALRQSILKKAFEGKLVPQDPNDEPASVLLERIKAERASAQPLKKTKTKKVKA